MKNELTPAQMALRIIIVIVIILILLVISFGIVRFIPKLITSFSDIRNSILQGGKEKLTLSLDKTEIEQGDAASLSFKKTGGKAEGFYTLSYSCAGIHTDTYLEITFNDEFEALDCEEAFPLGEAASSTVSGQIKIEPVSDSLSYDQPIKLTINHSTETSSIASSSATLTLKGDENATEEDDSDDDNDDEDSGDETDTDEPVATPARPTTSTGGSNYATPAAGPSDLFAVFTIRTIDNSDRAMVRFDVSNFGGRPTGAWRFRAILPRDQGTTIYESPYQSSIPAGKTSTMILTFDNAVDGGIVTVVLDPANQIGEKNEANNQLSTQLK